MAPPLEGASPGAAGPPAHPLVDFGVDARAPWPRRGPHAFRGGVQHGLGFVAPGLPGRTSRAAPRARSMTTASDQFFTDWDESFESFDEMGLHENLLRGIYAYGFEKPSAIQQKGIVPFTKGHDVIQQAQSGTGKTATFCAGILQNLDYNVGQCQALVLAPTRELAQQIEKVMKALGDYLKVKCHACVGGTSVREDQRVLSEGVHVVVGTPGRVFDMLRRRALLPDYIKMFVLDEADEMLSRGFKDQIYDIFRHLPPKLQVGRCGRGAACDARAGARTGAGTGHQRHCGRPTAAVFART